MTKKTKTCIEHDCTNPPLGWSNGYRSGNFRQLCEVHHDLEYCGEVLTGTWASCERHADTHQGACIEGVIRKVAHG